MEILRLASQSRWVASVVTAWAAITKHALKSLASSRRRIPIERTRIDYDPMVPAAARIGIYYATIKSSMC